METVLTVLYQLLYKTFRASVQYTSNQRKLCRFLFLHVQLFYWISSCCWPTCRPTCSQSQSI